MKSPTLPKNYKGYSTKDLLGILEIMGLQMPDRPNGYTEEDKAKMAKHTPAMIIAAQQMDRDYHLTLIAKMSETWEAENMALEAEYAEEGAIH